MAARLISHSLEVESVLKAVEYVQHIVDPLNGKLESLAGGLESLSNSVQCPDLRTEKCFTQLKAPISSLSSEPTLPKDSIGNRHEVQQSRDEETVSLRVNVSSMNSLDRNKMQSHMSDMRISETNQIDTPCEQEFKSPQCSPGFLCPKDMDSLVSCSEPSKLSFDLLVCCTLPGREDLFAFSV